MWTYVKFALYAFLTTYVASSDFIYMFSCTENRHYCIMIATDVTGWPKSTKIKYINILGDQMKQLFFTFTNIKMIFV